MCRGCDFGFSSMEVTVTGKANLVVGVSDRLGRRTEGFPRKSPTIWDVTMRKGVVKSTKSVNEWNLNSNRPYIRNRYYTSNDNSNFYNCKRIETFERFY